MLDPLRNIWDRFWRRFQPRTLRAQIMFLIGLVDAAILALTTISVYTFVYRVESEAWRGRQFEAARNAAQTIDAFLKYNQDTLRWADTLFYDRANDQTKILSMVVEQNPAFLEIILLSPKGHTLANAARSDPVLGNLFTIPQAEWFQKALEGEVYYTRVQLSPTYEPYLIFAMRARQGGVIAARIKTDVLRQVVAEIHFGRGGSVFVINELGQVNAHTDPQVVLYSTTMQDSPEYETIIQAPRHEWYGQRWNFNHQRVVCVSTAVGDMGWTVVTELPVSEAYAASRQIRLLLPLGMIILLTVTTLFIRQFFIRIFLKSVDQLREGAAHFAEGDLGFRMPISHMDELGEVMSVFNQMAVRLEAQRLSLEYSWAQLQESERQYRLLAEHASDVIWLRDMNLRLLYTSPSEQGLRGYLPEESMQQTIEQTLTPASAARAIEFFSEILRQVENEPQRDWANEYRSLELEVLCKDGTSIWTESRLGFLLDVQGKPYQILGVTRDISRRRQVEQELRELNEQLEERVQTRTAELSELNKNLLQEIDERKRTEKLLQNSLLEKDVLLKEIHHRVKNNLQIISSLINLQSRSVADPRTREVLNESQNRVRSMALIHERLYQTDNLAQVNFRDYLESLVPSLLRSYHHSGGTISLHFAVEDIPLPLEIAIPCGLIVNELVTNALKYAFPGERSGCLVIELHRTADQLYLLRVADDGVGLPPGLDVLHAPSLGLQLVNSLTGQLDGALKCRRQDGTMYEITFRGG